MNKSEEKDEKSWKGQTKHRNLTKVNKQPENEVRAKADDFSNAFPNFSVLNEEERFAFFEALTAARKNVEKRGVPTRERFGTVHDEYLKYYDRHEQEENQVQSEGVTSKLKSHSLLHGDSITPPLDRSSSPEPEKGIFDEGAHSPTLNLEYTSEVLREESLVITEPESQEERESNTEQNTSEMVNFHQKKTTKNEDENFESQMPCVTAPKARATPRFDALNTEEKEVFFRILQEAHNTVLQNNPGKESDIRSISDIMRRYQGDQEMTSVVKALNEKEECVNLKVKITLTSGDNERLKNSKPQTLDNLENEIGTQEQKSEDFQPEISREKVEEKMEEKMEEKVEEKVKEKLEEKLEGKPEKKDNNGEENFCIPDSSDTLKEQDSFLDKNDNKQIKTNVEGQTPSKQKVTTREQTPMKEIATTKEQTLSTEKMKIEQTPLKEKVKTKEQTPSKEKMTIEQTPSKEKIKTKEQTPSKEKMTIEQTPSKEKVKTKEQTPSKEKMTIEQTPSKEKIKTKEQTPSKEKMTIEQTPSKEKVKTKEQTPSKEKMTIEQTPSKEKVKTKEQTPSKEKMTIEQTPSREKMTIEQTPSKEKVKTKEQTPSKEKMTIEQTPSREKMTIEQTPSKEKIKTKEQTPSKEKMTIEQKPSKEKLTKESQDKLTTAEEELKKKKNKITDKKPTEAVTSHDNIKPETNTESTEELLHLNDSARAKQKANKVKKPKEGEKTEKRPDTEEYQNREMRDPNTDDKKTWKKGSKVKKFWEKLKKKDESVEFDYALEKESTDRMKRGTREDDEKTKDMEGTYRTGSEKSTESECEECMSRNRSEAQFSSLLLESVKKDSKEKKLGEENKKGSGLENEKSLEKSASELSVRLAGREYDETCSSAEKPTISNSSSSSCSSLYAGYLNRELPREFSVQNLNAESTEAVKSLVLESSTDKSMDDSTQRTSCAEEQETLRQIVPTFTTGKVMLVDDNVVDRIRKLIYYLDAKVQKDDRLEKEYMRLLVDYAEYLSRVLESLVSRKRRHQAQNTFTTAEARLQFDNEFGSKNKKNQKKNSKLDPMSDNIPRSVSAQDLRKYPTTIISKKPKFEKSKDHQPGNKETLSPILSGSSSSSGSDGVSRFVPLYSGEKTKIVTTKIRTLQDLLHERAEFVEGSVADFKIVYHPEQDFVPVDKPVGLQLIADDEEEHLQQGGNKFFRKLIKCCTCGRKGDEEDGIFENLKGEAVRVDVYDDKKRDAASATLNRSTMEVLKASERKKMIEQYYKTD